MPPRVVSPTRLPPSLAPRVFLVLKSTNFVRLVYRAQVPTRPPHLTNNLALRAALTNASSTQTGGALLTIPAIKANVLFNRLSTMNRAILCCIAAQQRTVEQLIYGAPAPGSTSSPASRTPSTSFSPTPTSSTLPARSLSGAMNTASSNVFPRRTQRCKTDGRSGFGALWKLPLHHFSATLAFPSTFGHMPWPTFSSRIASPSLRLASSLPMKSSQASNPASLGCVSGDAQPFAFLKKKTIPKKKTRFVLN